MPQDAVTISYLTKELNTLLLNGKIQKITMPEADEVNISVYSQSKNYNLVISINGSSPRLHLTKEQKTSPTTPPSFCMLLRKYLSGATITGVSSVIGERIIYIDFLSKTEMKDEASFRLVTELMNRQSNCFLLGNDGVILGSIKPQYAEACEKRLLVVSSKYELPFDNGKASPISAKAIYDALSTFNNGDIAKQLCDKVSGFSYQTACEIAILTFGQTELKTADTDDIKRFSEAVFSFINMTDIKPNVTSANSKIMDFFAVPYKSQTLDKEYFGTLNEAEDAFYCNKVKQERMGEHSRQIRQILKNSITKNEKKLKAQREDLLAAEKYEINKVYGDIITANLFKLSGGEKELLAENFYAFPVETISIPLDSRLSPSKNAQVYYKKYAKQKRSVEFTTEQIADTTETLEQLRLVETRLLSAKEISDLELIKDDLIALGYMKKLPQKGKKTPVKTFKPHKYLIDGYTLFVGRNSLENNYVTFELGHSKDIFFHAKKNFGAHVLLKYEGKPFTDDIYVKAAEIAAFYSNGSPEERIEIDYTEIKNVKKVKGGKIGLVIYHTNYSMFVLPSQHKSFLI